MQLATKNWKFQKTNMVDGHHLEKQKIVTSPKPFGQF